MSGIDFPTPLVEAHESGDLVIFIGAGASIPPPSALPSFMELVRTIRDESNLLSEIGDIDDQRLDEVLGRIADDYGVDVHERIHDLTSRKGSRPSPVHKAIVKLASASTIRIVTTNYDHHLSTLLDLLHEEVPEYFAPALPMGDDFAGIVYIHGRLDQERRRLVATDDDFGKAYLTDAWAARFLDRMFATRPVLFVGYSHKDTIMKYLARGLGGRSEKRYAITDDSESSLWRQLGITPIHCSHDDIAAALNDWATRASGGLLGHRARVKALVADQDPTPIPETMSYLERSLAARTPPGSSPSMRAEGCGFNGQRADPSSQRCSIPHTTLIQTSRANSLVGLPRTTSLTMSCRILRSRSSPRRTRTPATICCLRSVVDSLERIGR